MPVRVVPEPPGRVYGSHAAAVRAWARGEPFRVADRWHPRYGEAVTRATLREPVTVRRSDR